LYPHNYHTITILQFSTSCFKFTIVNKCEQNNFVESAQTCVEGCVWPTFYLTKTFGFVRSNFDEVSLSLSQTLSYLHAHTHSLSLSLSLTHSLTYTNTHTLSTRTHAHSPSLTHTHSFSVTHTQSFALFCRLKNSLVSLVNEVLRVEAENEIERNENFDVNFNFLINIIPSRNIFTKYNCHF